MDRLSLSEIADYNTREAFARARSSTASSAATFLESVQSASDYSKLKSSGIEASYSILNGISDRLELIRANLSTMLGYAQEGATAATESDRDEYIGLLRSLSGGVDDIVDNTVWQGTKLLDGRSIELSMTTNGGGASETLELQSYYTSDEDGFDLTDQPAAGKGTIYYDYYALYRNADAGVVGLDITKASGVDTASTQNELETGSYRLEISYAGPDSSITIKDSEGTYINTVKDVDLSGTGEEIVDLEVGVALTIEKEQILQSIDKYDYENEGPAKLYAMLYYEQTFEHKLKQEGFEEFSDQSVTVNYQSDLDDGSGGTLSFDTIKTAGVDDDVLGMASGQYTVSVNYNGSSSSVFVKDSAGKLAYLDYRVDLSGSDPVTIDTGKGLAFTISNDGFDGTGKMAATISYEADGNNNEDFDFVAYGNKIEEAIERLDEDLLEVAQAMDRVYTMYQYQQGNFGTGGNSTSGAQATSLITGAAGSNSIFSAANGILSTSAEEIFTNAASAISAQSDVLYAKYLA